MTTEEFTAPDDDTNDDKTAYAFYGLAVYMAMVMEKNVIGLLVPHRIALAKAEGRTLRKDPWEQAAKESLKNNIRAVAPLITGDASLHDALLTAADRRNHLAHDFWYENADSLFADGPRQRLIAELKNDIETFGALSRRIDSISDALTDKRLGITASQLSSVLQQAIGRARAAT